MLFLEKNFKNDNFLIGIKTKQDKRKNSNIVEKIWFASASNFKSFSRSVEQFFLTENQINFGTKVPYLFEERSKKKKTTCVRISLARKREKEAQTAVI